MKTLRIQSHKIGKTELSLSKFGLSFPILPKRYRGSCPKCKSPNLKSAPILSVSTLTNEMVYCAVCDQYVRPDWTNEIVGPKR
jgi:hypothetical protein